MAGGSLLGEIFPGGGGMSKFLAGVGGLPAIPLLGTPWSIEVKITQWSNYKENTTGNYYEDNEQRHIKNKNCMKCDKYVEQGVKHIHWQRYFKFKCEGTRREKVMQE